MYVIDSCEVKTCSNSMGPFIRKEIEDIFDCDKKFNLFDKFWVITSLLVLKIKQKYLKKN